MLAGVSSGIGKTTISMALMSVFKNVSPFKVGPDYIDPTFHEFITGNKSYNLDLFMMGEEGVKYSFFKHQKEISIVEGVMGLYDGLDNSLDNNSSAHIARILGLPVILVVDGIGKSTSIAAQVLGYKMLDSRVKIAGVIINKVSSAKTYEIFREAIETYTGIKCLGYVLKNEEFSIGSRHLGLLQANEVSDLKKKMELLKKVALEHIDISEIETIAEQFNKNHIPERVLSYPMNLKKMRGRYQGQTVAIARDSAFSFYYNDNLEFLEYLGFSIQYFSPIKDQAVPECNIIYFGGGYPENFAKELSENKEMLASIQKKKAEGVKIFAECGGFMYLSQGIEQLNGEFYPMCALLPCTVNMTTRLDISRFGYISILSQNTQEKVAKGHEFHYSKLKEIREDTRKFKAQKKDGRTWDCIFREENLYAGYPHIHFFGSIPLLEEILSLR